MEQRESVLSRALELLADRGPELADAFYSKLFERCPDIAALFLDADMGNQDLMLTSALIFTLESLGSPERLATRVRHLGHVHRHAGVREEHFGPFNECLLEALREAAGRDWSPGMEELWGEALGRVTGLMLEGLRGA